MDESSLAALAVQARRNLHWAVFLTAVMALILIVDVQLARSVARQCVKASRLLAAAAALADGGAGEAGDGGSGHRGNGVRGDAGGRNAAVAEAPAETADPLLRPQDRGEGGGGGGTPGDGR